MSKLNEFKDMVGNIKDPDLLSSGQTLLKDLMELNILKRKVLEIEASLTDASKAPLYFFASELNEDEIPFALENLNGRIKVVNKNIKKDS